MSDLLKQLKKLAGEQEFEVIEFPDGKIDVIGGLRKVSWWPTSRRMTAYIEGAPRGQRFTTPRQVIEMALKGK